MSTNIERVRYYDGEYLRSADFIAEQKYHVEMRRRINLALHLSGIVDGLDIEADDPVPGVPPPGRFHVTAGMAIDAYGREILLPYAFALDDELLLIHRISQAASYSLWIAYDRQQGTPAEAGSRNCHTQDHDTRWHESYRVIISNDPEPADKIAFTGTLRDDSEPPIRRVRLGTVNVVSNAGKLTIDSAQAEARTYIGLRTQRVVTPTVRPLPPVSSTAPTTNPTLSANSSATPPLSVGIEANLFAEKDLIVGDNFAIDPAKITPPPPGPTFPRANGNAKIAGDIFLKGNLYTAGPTDEWLGLRELVQSLMPEILIGTKTIPVAASTLGAEQESMAEVIVSLQTRLPKVSGNPMMVVAISEMRWLSLSDDQVWATGVGATSISPIQTGVSVSLITDQGSGKYDFTLRAKIGPTDTVSSKVRVTSLTVSYVAIFNP